MKDNESTIVLSELQQEAVDFVNKFIGIIKVTPPNRTNIQSQDGRISYIKTLTENYSIENYFNLWLGLRLALEKYQPPVFSILLGVVMDDVEKINDQMIEDDDDYKQGLSRSFEEILRTNINHKQLALSLTSEEFKA